jgi:hypothetical protein
MYVDWRQIEYKAGKGLDNIAHDILTTQYFLDVLEVFVNSYIFVSR